MTKLRSYRTATRARVYAVQLHRRFPGARFEVRLLPFQAYAFRYGILCTQSARGNAVAGAWVSR